jgi:hypothetical protein
MKFPNAQFMLKLIDSIIDDNDPLLFRFLVEIDSIDKELLIPKGLFSCHTPIFLPIAFIVAYFGSEKCFRRIHSFNPNLYLPKNSQNLFVEFSVIGSNLNIFRFSKHYDTGNPNLMFFAAQTGSIDIYRFLYHSVSTIDNRTTIFRSNSIINYSSNFNGYLSEPSEIAIYDRHFQLFQMILRDLGICNDELIGSICFALKSGSIEAMKWLSQFFSLFDYQYLFLSGVASGSVEMVKALSDLIPDENFDFSQSLIYTFSNDFVAIFHFFNDLAEIDRIFGSVPQNLLFTVWQYDCPQIFKFVLKRYQKKSKEDYQKLFFNALTNYQWRIIKLILIEFDKDCHQHSLETNSFEFLFIPNIKFLSSYVIRHFFREMYKRTEIEELYQIGFRINTSGIET